MKRILIAGLILSWAVATRADTITNLAGHLSLPGESLTYNFTITNILTPNFGGEVQATIDGLASLMFTAHPENNVSYNPNFGTFIFQQNETVSLFEFALYTKTDSPYEVPQFIKGYEFIDSVNGPFIEFKKGTDPVRVDNNGKVLTPEPTAFTLLLLAIGGWMIYWGLYVPKEERMARRLRRYRRFES